MAGGGGSGGGWVAKAYMHGCIIFMKLHATGRHDMIVFRKGEAPKLEIQTKISLETVGPEFLVVQITQCLSQGNGTTLPKCVRGHSSVPGLARSIATSI